MLSKLHTLLRIMGTLIRHPYSIKRVLPDEESAKSEQDGMEHLTHDEIYDGGYFQYVELTTRQSADVIANSIIETFHPSSVVDVACGTGILLDRLRTKGVQQVKGLEFAKEGLKLCHMRQLEVKKFDVENDHLPQEMGNADVVISMEAGHQLHEESADRYVDLLCQIADVVIFSSATPGQGDRYPRNEQHHQYWIEKFGERGYQIDEKTTLQWRTKWQAHGTEPWFYRNAMIFRRDSKAGLDMKAYTVYRYDFIRQVKEPIGMVLERRKEDRGNNNEDLLKLAQKLYSTGSWDPQISISLH